MNPCNVPRTTWVRGTEIETVDPRAIDEPRNFRASIGADTRCREQAPVDRWRGVSNCDLWYADWRLLLRGASRPER